MNLRIAHLVAGYNLKIQGKFIFIRLKLQGNYVYFILVGAKQCSSALPAFDLMASRAKQVKLLLCPYKIKLPPLAQ